MTTDDDGNGGGARKKKKKNKKSKAAASYSPLINSFICVFGLCARFFFASRDASS
jgi:hypothetical protein